MQPYLNDLDMQPYLNDLDLGADCSRKLRIGDAVIAVSRSFLLTRAVPLAIPLGGFIVVATRAPAIRDRVGTRHCGCWPPLCCSGGASLAAILPK